MLPLEWLLPLRKSNCLAIAIKLIQICFFHLLSCFQPVNAMCDWMKLMSELWNQLILNLGIFAIAEMKNPIAKIRNHNLVFQVEKVNWVFNCGSFQCFSCANIFGICNPFESCDSVQFFFFPSLSSSIPKWFSLFLRFVQCLYAIFESSWRHMHKHTQRHKQPPDKGMQCIGAMLLFCFCLFFVWFFWSFWTRYLSIDEAACVARPAILPWSGRTTVCWLACMHSYLWKPVCVRANSCVRVCVLKNKNKSEGFQRKH